MCLCVWWILFWNILSEVVCVVLVFLLIAISSSKEIITFWKGELYLEWIHQISYIIKFKFSYIKHSLITKTIKAYCLLWVALTNLITVITKLTFSSYRRLPLLSPHFNHPIISDSVRLSVYPTPYPRRVAAFFMQHPKFVYMSVFARYGTSSKEYYDVDKKNYFWFDSCWRILLILCTLTMDILVYNTVMFI